MSKAKDLSELGGVIVTDGSNVGIGTSSPATYGVDNAEDLVIGQGDGNHGITISSFNTSNGTIAFSDTTNATVGRGFVDYDHNVDAMSFGTLSSERMRIDSSGNLLIGSTTNVGTGDHKVSISIGGGGRALGLSSTATTTKLLASFINPNGTVGSIRTSGTSTSYVTSSDYRLKENITEITDGIERVKQLNPSRFNFIADADTTVDGFIAHEAATVVPEAVVGEKDAIDADGNLDPQGIDQSKLVPLLTAALKEAIAKIETLETKVAALETN